MLIITSGNNKSVGTESIVQAAHGLSVHNAVYKANSGVWTLARADVTATLKHGIVSNVIDANTFDVTYYGMVTVTGHGFNVGATYVLSNTAAGQSITPVPVDIEFTQATFEVLDADSYRVLDQAVFAGAATDTTILSNQTSSIVSRIETIESWIAAQSGNV